MDFRRPDGSGYHNFARYIFSSLRNPDYSRCIDWQRYMLYLVFEKKKRDRNSSLNRKKLAKFPVADLVFPQKKTETKQSGRKLSTKNNGKTTLGLV